MANTYQTMQTRIADELDRADLSGGQIQNAIQDAIGLYERKYFYFTSNPATFSFNTVSGQEYYTSSDNAAIATISQIDMMVGTFYGLRRPVRKESWQYLASISTLTTSLAQPERFAYLGEQIRLYPIPNGAFSIAVEAIARPTRPSANSDAGVWMNDAEAVIRTHAKINLLTNVIRASDMADEVGLLEMTLKRELSALYEETRTREATGHVDPVRF